MFGTWPQKTILQCWLVLVSSKRCRDWTLRLAITSSNVSNAASARKTRSANQITVPGCSPAYTMLLCKELA